MKRGNLHFYYAIAVKWKEANYGSKRWRGRKGKEITFHRIRD